MGRIQASIPDDLEKELRMLMAKRYGWRKGALKDVVTRAQDGEL